MAIVGTCAAFIHKLSSIYNNKIQMCLADVSLSKHLSFLLLQDQHNLVRKKWKEEFRKMQLCISSKLSFIAAQKISWKSRLYMKCIGIGISRICVGVSKQIVWGKCSPALLNLLLVVHTPIAYCWKNLVEVSIISFSGWFKKEISYENSIKSIYLNPIEH